MVRSDVFNATETVGLVVCVLTVISLACFLVWNIRQIQVTERELQDAQDCEKWLFYIASTNVSITHR
jgi:hypothetical protein